MLLLREEEKGYLCSEDAGSTTYILRRSCVLGSCTRDIYSLAKIMGSNEILTAELLRQDIVISKTVVVRITCNMSEYPAKIPRHPLFDGK